MSLRLKNKIALVTGGASGVGQGIVRRFVAAGASVAIGDIDEQAGRSLVCELGEGTHFVALDVSEESSFYSAINETVSHWGRLDILVNNAGIVVPALPVQDTSTEEFNRLVRVNLGGAFFGCRYAYPHILKTKGCVLNISSLVGVVGEKNHAIYGATKGAINALTICTAADWRTVGLRINALCPSDVWTSALEGWIKNQPDPSIAQHYERMRTQGLCADPTEIGDIALFLCSNEARFINGAVINASFGVECGYEL
jgi:meso-butanediol dehydrogenase / (S,S)-butanediol dehydrogenase / diacetyl reductase